MAGVEAEHVHLLMCWVAGRTVRSYMADDAP